jgi:hypothetical protein
MTSTRRCASTRLLQSSLEAGALAISRACLDCAWDWVCCRRGGFEGDSRSRVDDADVGMMEGAGEAGALKGPKENSCGVKFSVSNAKIAVGCGNKGVWVG